MNNKTLTIAAVLAAALLAGIFSATTPMAAYAEDDYDDDDHDDDGGDSSETNTEQSIKQKNEGGVGSSQFNCGQNNINPAEAENGLVELDVDACGTIDVGVLTGLIGGVTAP
jgi:hypothetical protein